MPESNYMGYVHSKHARNWEVYEQSSSEVCAKQSLCFAYWFDREAPESEEEYMENEDRFVVVAVFAVYDGKVSGEIDCYFIDVSDVDPTDPDKASVKCSSGKIEP